MEADWDEIHRIAIPPPRFHYSPTPASTLAFDTQQELLWVGNEYGRVTSFYGPELQKYTSIQAHPENEGPVKQLLFHERGIISVAPKSVHLSSRRGLTQWHIADHGMYDMRCMSFLGKDNSEILVAGCQKTMFKIDVEKGRVIEEIATEENYTMMKYGHYICAATKVGSVNILDADTLRIVKTWKAHTAGISDMDARNNYLVTCGWSTRPQGTLMLDPLANVFDLRAMMPLPPIPFHAGAAFVQMHPRMSTTSIVASQSGQLQVVDLMNPNTVNLRQANISSYMSGLVLAPSGEALALTDQECTIHLWGSMTKMRYAEYSNPTEFADPPTPLPSVDWSLDSPLSMVGMPYYREQLLSAWPSTQVYEVGNPPSKINATTLASLTQTDFGGFAPNTRKLRRNQVEKTRAVETNGTALAAPKFLSEKAREPDNNQSSGRRISDAVVEALANASLKGVTKAEVPLMYRNVEIKYSKFGVDDFDFEYYNKTHYSGLETHITNSYSNPLLQLFKFIPLLRNLALHHAATTCLSESCLLCEMGFLFDMLDKAGGQSCQATNFLKTFNNKPKAAKLGLLEEHSPAKSLSAMIQEANSFLLEQISDDYKDITPDPSQIDQTLAIEAFSKIRCVHCQNETTRYDHTNSVDLIYQHLDTNHRPRSQFKNFSQILKESVEPVLQRSGWCDKCRRYQPLTTRKTILGIPMVLMINTALKSQEAQRLWSVPGWLPEEIGIIVEGGEFFCYEDEELRLHLLRNRHVVTVYELVGLVADINSGEHQKSHLVSLINVTISERTPQAESQWHLFNDFLVRKVTKEEALRFSPSWKVPVVLAYQIKTASNAVDDSWKDNLDTTLLYYNWSINNQQPRNSRVLRPDVETPVEGYHVAIDTEFVALQQEEIEIKADGEREIVRPTRLGLARVSVLRGNGDDEGVPFINDYITISEPIVDYLTKWSGVQDGDLDPRYSTHNLVPLKVAYKKLWLLLNIGCVFVGHGLPKDFRTINIHVPKSQVVDTVDLFYIRARQRKLSLRFLAWYLLKEDIQQETHDSIEDARTALRLWKKYQEFRDAGVVEQMLEEIYREGKKWGYKPPGESIDAGLGRRLEGRSTETPSLGGRETPPLLQAGSGVVTPGGRRGAGRTGEYFESPLR